MLVRDRQLNCKGKVTQLLHRINPWVTLEETRDYGTINLQDTLIIKVLTFKNCRDLWTFMNVRFLRGDEGP